MNITPEFRTSREWKKFKRAISHPAAMEFYVNVCCELEGITRKTKDDEGFLGTTDAEDIALMCGAEDYEEIEPDRLLAAFLESGLMVQEEGKYRMISWEIQNANLISSRKNGRRGGRPSSKTERNENDNLNSNNNLNSNKNLNGNLNSNETITEHNEIERNETERNVTGGLAHGYPTVNPGFSEEDEEYPF